MLMNKLPLYPVVLAYLLSQSVAFAQRKMDDMRGMDMGKKPAPTAQSNAQLAVGMVTKVDAKAGTVTHGPWASQNIELASHDDELQSCRQSVVQQARRGQEIEIEFTQVDKDYVVNAVK